MKALVPFLIAVQFLTRLPVPSLPRQKASVIGRSLLYYPVVGLLIGAVLVGFNAALNDTPGFLRSALLLAVWVILTGALHLDGLADSADAWVGGLGDRKRTLAIMKDPRCGPAAVVALVIALLVKMAALRCVGENDWLALIAVPMLARASIVSLFLTTPYVRANGLGTPLSAHLPRTAATGAILLSAVAALALSDAKGLWLLLATTIVFALLRAAMIKRIGGTTGDTAGATIELTEIALLLVIALSPN
jgi:adenosylcobinamide-GDP ribazoletransferase